MREILFRGKRIDNGEWVEGYYLQFHDMHIIIPAEAKDSEHFYLFDFAVEVIPETVGQYTGLTDSNGKKIFEGDVMRYKDELLTVIGVVKFGTMPQSCDTKIVHTGYYIEWQNDGTNMWNDWWRNDIVFWLAQDSCEVIGNTTDNPKLIGGGRE